MSRKDFELIATVLRDEAEGWPMDHPQQSHFAALRLAFNDALKGTNPNYNEVRFLAAAHPRPTAYSDRIDAMRASIAS
jgi:hypothetical protein